MRNISGRIFEDAFFSSLPWHYRLLFIGLVIRCADDQGRILDNSREIQLAIFPGDRRMRPEIIEAGIKLFARHKKIVRYRAGNNGSGWQLIQILNWWTYQIDARWAARSKYPAPARWVDRVRWHIEGNQIEKINWDFKPGGFIPTWRVAAHHLHRGYVAPVKPLNSRDNDIDIEDDIDNEDDSDLPTPLPPPRPGDQKAEGRKDAPKSKKDPFAKLGPAQRESAERIQRVLTAASFYGEQKVITLSVLMATRSSRADPISYVMAALASAYADPTANKKNGVAAHRIEHDQIDPAYLDPVTWRRVPAVILAAAGIPDIEQYIRTEKMNRALSR